MKFKIIIFLLAFLMSLSLVHAFESPEYNIGMDIPSGEQGDIEVIIESRIEFNITNETDDTNVEPNEVTTPGGSPSGGNPPENNNIISTEGDNFNSDNNLEQDNEIETINSVDDSPNVFSRITGAVVGTLGTGGTIGVFVFILGIIGAVVFVRIREKKLN